MFCRKFLATGALVIGLGGRQLLADSFVFDPYQPQSGGNYLDKILPSVSQVGNTFYLTTIGASWNSYDSSGLFNSSGAGPIHVTKLSPTSSGQYASTDLGDIPDSFAAFGLQPQLSPNPYSNYEKPILRGDTIAWNDFESLPHWYNVVTGTGGQLAPMRQYAENTRSDGNAIATTWYNGNGAPPALSIDNVTTGQRVSLDQVDSTPGLNISAVDIHADSSSSGRVVFTNAQGFPAWSTYNFSSGEISQPTPFNFIPAGTGAITMNDTWVVWKGGFNNSTNGQDILAVEKWNGDSYVPQGFLPAQLTSAATPDLPALFGDVLAVTDPSGSQIDLYNLNTLTEIGTISGNNETVDSPALWVDPNNPANYLAAYESHGSPYSGVATGPFISVLPEPTAVGTCGLLALLCVARRRARPAV